MCNDYVPEVRKLIEECLVGNDVNVDYLLNVLSYKKNQGKTVKEIFERELKAKKEFDIAIEPFDPKEDSPEYLNTIIE